MAATTVPNAKAQNGKVRLLGILVMVAGIVLIVAGVFTWIVITGQLSDENITVSEDADQFAGQQVNGPFTAYAQANVIEKHALEATGGLTYAELPRDSELRQTAMDASFLRASLFTSVVAYGVAAMAAGLGLVCLLIGLALMSLARAPVAVVQPVVPAGTATAATDDDTARERVAEERAEERAERAERTEAVAATPDTTTTHTTTDTTDTTDTTPDTTNRPATPEDPERPRTTET
jgi:hypothetical protein